MAEQEKLRRMHNEGRYELREKASRFLGFAFGIATEQEFTARLASVKKEYYDATHYCYAWRLYSGQSKYTDAGEPNGTAGIRIIGALDRAGLTNSGIIVVRYYGGTKLGTGPLGKAYAEAAAEAVNHGSIAEEYLHLVTTLTFQAAATGTAYHLIKRFGLRIEETGGSEQVALTISGRKELMLGFTEFLAENGLNSTFITGSEPRAEFRSD